MTVAGGIATVADLFEAGAARTPDAPAVESGAQDLSFERLDRSANALARRLQRLGVGPGVPVAALCHRSPEWTVALLATMKAGGACLPIDPAVPDERLDFFLTDSAAPVVLVQPDLAARLSGQEATTVELAGAALDGGRAEDATAPTRTISGADIAYVIYTSGSTGVPKGVLLTHGGLVNEHRAVADLYRLGPGDRVLQFCSPGFDISIEELFPTWGAGATVVLRDDEVPILGRSWCDWLGDHDISVLNLPTAYWHEWTRDLHATGGRLPDCVRLVIVGGEKALGRSYRQWLEVGGDHARWINAYGPTETTIMATWFEPDRTWPAGEDDDPPIGRPLAGTTTVVLDDRGRPVAPGGSGELLLGGAGVARGYLNRPELTAQRFVPDPTSLDPAARLYRSGDQVRVRPDGNLVFVGRLDQQVKVRGFRVECGEVEVALAKHRLVDQAVVVAREDEPGYRRLVGYTVPTGDPPPTAGELRRFLATRLPPYLIPTAFVSLESFPLTTSGKVDRDRLPAPRRVAPGAGDGQSARSATEAVLASIWAQVLGFESVGRDEDFFDLGGQSLLATQVVARARAELLLDVPLHTLFEAPTVRGMAHAVDALAAAPALPAEPLTASPLGPEGEAPLSLPQEQMWELEAQASPPGLYNVTALHRFAEPVDVERLTRAVELLVARHDALRTSFVCRDGAVAQRVSSSAPIPVEVTDVDNGDGDGDRQQEQITRLIAAQDAAPFELGEAPLARCHLYRPAGQPAVFAATFDHMICDGTSAYVFLSELADGYQALTEGRDPSPPPLKVQYPDFARWQRRSVTAARERSELAYWRRTLADLPSGPALAFDSVPAAPSRRIARRPLWVTPDGYGGLKTAARRTHGSLFVAITAAVAAVLHSAGGATDVVFSTTVSGRQRAELDGVIGYFANIGRLRVSLADDPTVAQVLERARDTVFGLFEHDNVPFLRIRKALIPDLGAKQGVHPLAALPIELQFFHAGQDGWAPGIGVVERPGPEKGPDELFFRGQLHPLSLSFLDDGTQVWGEINYKTDFYRPSTIEGLALGLERLLPALASQMGRRLSELPDLTAPAPRAVAPGEGLSSEAEGDAHGTQHRPVGTWQLT